jgi:hypothetical protein
MLDVQLSDESDGRSDAVAFERVVCEMQIE